MKNKIMWKIFLVMILTILVIFIAITLRKFIIISDLDMKASKQNEKTNIYMKINTSQVTTETYKKNDVIKSILTYKTSNKKITEIKDGTSRFVYTENKVFNDTYNTGNTKIISNAVYTMDFFEKLRFSILSNISLEDVNGKECYEIKNKNNPNFFIPEGCIDLKVYVEKETGLVLKVITEYEDGKEEITIYEYLFDSVTDKDMEKPDII